MELLSDGSVGITQDGVDKHRGSSCILLIFYPALAMLALIFFAARGQRSLSSSTMTMCTVLSRFTHERVAFDCKVQISEKSRFVFFVCMAGSMYVLRTVLH